MTWSTTLPTIDPLLQNKLDCLETLNRTSTVANGNGKYCNGTWDGWACWPDTLAGSSAQVLCPEFITGFDPTRFAHKECGLDGVWFKHPETNKTWSNYTTCINLDDLEWRQQVNLIYETGYAISLIALLLSLAILFYFRSLKCARITIHINLFCAFAANNSLWLLWYRVVLGEPDVISENKSGCMVLHLVLHYFLMTSYAWMLCEGFYLHTVLVSAFISEQRLVRWLMVFGWSSPAIVLTVYGFSRGFHGSELDRKECWMNETLYTNVLVAPVCVSMLLNLLFLCNIVRVLVLKLKAPLGGNSGPSRNIIQAFRATLLLVPLLGLQYILTPFKPQPGHSWERAYETISAFTASFQVHVIYNLSRKAVTFEMLFRFSRWCYEYPCNIECKMGLCVATLFCFCNGEVIAQIKRKWRSIFFSNRPRSNSYTATQVSFVRCGPPVSGEVKV